MKAETRLGFNKTCEDPFWNSDIEVIESAFLKKNEKITDLPTYLDWKVPHQGSVILHKVARLENKKNTSFNLRNWLLSLLK